LLPSTVPLSFVTLEFLPEEVILEDWALQIMFPSPQCFLWSALRRRNKRPGCVYTIFRRWLTPGEPLTRFSFWNFNQRGLAVGAGEPLPCARASQVLAGLRSPGSPRRLICVARQPGAARGGRAHTWWRASPRRVLVRSASRWHVGPRAREVCVPPWGIPPPPTPAGGWGARGTRWPGGLPGCAAPGASPRRSPPQPQHPAPSASQVLTPVPVARADSAHAPHLGEARRAGAERGDRERPLSPRSRWVGQFRGPAAQSCRRCHRPGLPQTAGERLRGAPAQPWRERRLPGAGHIPPASGAAAPRARRPPPARRGKPGASSPAPRPRLSPPPPPRRGTEFALRPAAPLVEAGAWPLPRPQSRGSP
jgi:hypothetical protein